MKSSKWVLVLALCAGEMVGKV